MLIPQIALLLLLLFVCSFAPGFFLVRRLRWSPMEKLCGAVGLSIILLYLASGLLYVTGIRGAFAYAAVSLACFGLGAAAWRDIAALFRIPVVRRAAAGFGFILLWTITLLAMIRVYSGAGWFGDWLEHFQRSLFWLQHFPIDTPIFPGYILPARPPLMNVVAAFFLAQTQDRFELFQIIFTFFNLLLFLPCCLLMPALGRPGKRRILLLTGLFAMNPVIMENATYSWTKSGAAFYVLLAICFYLAGWRKKDTVRTTAAFVALAAGLLAHYSAGPYIVFLAGHYMLGVFPKRSGRWRELAGIAIAAGLVLATWFGWSMTKYGVKKTLASNTSVTASQSYQGNTASKIVLNFYDTVVPVMLRNPEDLAPIQDQRSPAGMLRDKIFVFYQLNVIFNMGLIGGPLVLWLLYRAFRPRKSAPVVKAAVKAKGKHAARAPARPPAAGAGETIPLNREQRFWLMLIGVCLVLGMAVIGERDKLGQPHITYLTLITLGLALLAAAPWRSKAVAALLLAGCAVDFGAGVYFQARVESQENTPRETVYGEMAFREGRFYTDLPPGSLSTSAWSNWYRKHIYELTGKWLTEMPKLHGGDPSFDQQWPPMAERLKSTRDQDANYWHGWFSRNGGYVEHLGDQVAGADGSGIEIASGALLVLFLGLAGALWRQALR